MRCFSLSHETTLRNFTSRPFSRFCLASVGSPRNRDFAFGVEEETTGNKRKRGGPPPPSNPRRRSPPPRSPSPHRSKDYGSGDSDAEGHLSEGEERPPPPPPKNGKNHIMRDFDSGIRWIHIGEHQWQDPRNIRRSRSLDGRIWAATTRNNGSFMLRLKKDVKKEIPNLSTITLLAPVNDT